jgi:hypothetical protein
MNERPAPMPWYDWLMAIASIWVSGGIMIDAWHHFHEDVETFFEPAHGLLYAGLLAAYVFTGIAVVVNRKSGFAFKNALPLGYETTKAGLIVFALGGILDMIKHSIWGFEQGFDALVSPTHLLIGAGMFLVIAGPIATALKREHQPSTLLGQLPMLLAAASMMELVHWGTQFIFLSEAESMNAPLMPTAFPHDTLTLLTLQYYKEGVGLLAVIVQSILIVGFTAYLGRRIRLSFGAVVALLVVGNAFIAGAHSNYNGQFAAVLVASLVAGLCADALKLAPDAEPWRWRWFAFASPALYWSALLTVLSLTMHGLWWAPDIVLGSILFAGFSGLFINAISSTAG